MQSDRRSFIRFVVAGSVAAGCPVDLSLLAAPAPTPVVDGEHNEICHQLRDGHHFSRPPASARHDIVIVGGGMSGLSCAWFLRDPDSDRESTTKSATSCATATIFRGRRLPRGTTL